MAPPKKIINSPEDAVEEFMQGLLLQYPDRLVRVANHPVLLLRTSVTTTADPAAAASSSSFSSLNVRLLSGGGSGHEPSHAGWIGKGMLSGAICGGIFASPSVTSILAAIRSCGGGGGTVAAAVADGTLLSSSLSLSKQPKQKADTPILLVVKNYTGDRLNFGMAAERVNQQGGWDVRMVVVADDCALPRTKGITGARGLAGTVLVHKVAGAAAQAGASMDAVVAMAKLTAQRMGTLGVALASVTVPGAASTNDRLDDVTIEIGLGIHGEAGLKQSPLLTANEMAREMITRIQDYGRVEVGTDGSESIVPMFQTGDDLCLLVNNLGGTSNFEMSILANACVNLIESAEFGGVVIRLLVGSYMTSFNMHGASLTILNLTGQEKLIELLDAPTDAPAWPPVSIRQYTSTTRSRPSAIPIPEPVGDPADGAVPPMSDLPALQISDFAVVARAAILAAISKLAEAESLLTKYDTIVGDGDCGITMRRGATEVRERLLTNEAATAGINTDHPIPMFTGLADAISASMGGTSGVLLELMFRKMGSTLGKCDAIGKPELCQAFMAGVDAVSFYGGAQVGARTMLDALVTAAKELLQTNDLTAAAQLARQGADGTARMKVASAGRSNYLSAETLEGTPDPGAVAVAIILESLAASA
jgi:triose/dihydroxyacetone kinase / FAD-AMP lyase (cyclizing)